MAETVGLLSIDTGCETCGISEAVDKMPLMESPIPLMTIFLTYIVFVLKVGPDYMRNRKPFGLKNLLLIYNFGQVLLSGYLFIRYFSYMWRTDFLLSQCNLHNIKYRDEIITHVWLYSMVKISDLLDTVFFVLRKKDNQITFLHLYHHSLMVVGTWMFLKYILSETVIFAACFNALVHFVMYGYYGLAALGPHMAPYLTWKKYLTAMQLVQFATLFIHYLFVMKYSECPPSKGIAVFLLMNLVVFIILFGNFYRKSYNKKSKSVLNENQNCDKTKSG